MHHTFINVEKFKAPRKAVTFGETKKNIRCILVGNLQEKMVIGEKKIKKIPEKNNNTQ